MKVDHLMTRDVETCRAEATLADAAMIMWRRDCGFVPVVEDASGKLVGVVTDRDICIATTTKHCAPAALPVGAIMSKQVVTCGPADDVGVAMRHMAEAQVRRLPVVDRERRVKGIVSLNDLVLASERSAGRGGDAVTYADVVGVLKPISAHRLPIKSAVA